MSRNSEEVISTDVLVVGGGLAGCWAALRAAELSPRVTLVDKGVVARSGTTVFCHDVLAPMPESELDVWSKEIVEHAEYMSDERFVEVLLKEGGKRINDMWQWGVPFETDDQGNLFLSLGRGHKQSKVVLVDCRKMMEVMKQQVQARGAQIVDRVMITDLLTSDGQLPTSGSVVGAVGIHTQTGKLLVFKAKAVILTTGVTSLKQHGAFADNVTGDAQAMAFRAGAELADLEFGFSQKFAWIHDGYLRITSLMPYQTQGARIVNAKGERFMERYAPDRGERRSGLGLLAQAAVKEIWEGRGPIYFDLRHFSREHLAQMKRILPLRYRPFEEGGLDPAKDLIETRLVVMYLSRGTCMDLWGETSVPGLFTGGICAHFPGGTELLSGCMLGVCSVFGYRAGERAARAYQHKEDDQISWEQVNGLKISSYAPSEREAGISPRELYNKLAARIMRPEYSVVKTEKKIQEFIKGIRTCKQEDMPLLFAPDVHELIKANEVRNFVDLLEPSYTAALERRESRLSHYRADYPFRDDGNWIKWIGVRRGSKGIEIRHRPVPLETNKSKPASLTKIPSLIQFSETVSSGPGPGSG